MESAIPRVRKDVLRAVRLQPELDRQFRLFVEARGSTISTELKEAIVAHLQSHD